MKRPQLRVPPPAENLARVGSQSFDVHVKRGYAILDTIEEEARAQSLDPDNCERILDFGCGVGRVAIPLAERRPGKAYGTDVDPTAIQFLNKHFDTLHAYVQNYEPPLHFESEFFDLIFSISVWSHLPANLQVAWLDEMHRIVKPGGLVMITTAGISHLKNWHAKGKRTDISVDSLERSGSLFIKNDRLQKRPEMFPGVTGDWGVFYQTEDHIRRTWSNKFEIRSVKAAHVGQQDLTVLRKTI